MQNESIKQTAMSNKKRILKEHIVNNEVADIVRVSLNYNVGGMNYFTSKVEERGIYLSVTPLNVSSGDGYSTVSYTAFSGIKKLVRPMKRFSQKQFDNFEPSDEDVKQLVDHVTNSNSIKLEQCKQQS
jgi:capsule polysaccharide modification protein KpsS